MNRRQFSSGLVGAAGALALHREVPTATTSRPDPQCSTDTSIKFKFAGLMVFHPSSGMFELGVLRARPHHILQIGIRPRTSADKPRDLDPDVLDSYVTGNDYKWSIDVKDNLGNAQTGVAAAIQIPANRHDSGVTTTDLGWIVNVESGEFHGNKVNRQINKLKPIIALTYGRLGTECLTESVDIYQGRNKIHDDFGYIAAETSLCIDISGGQTVALRTQKISDILGLKPGVPYDIEIFNTPASTAPPGGHFHYFYDLLFTGVGGNQRFSMKSHKPRNDPASGACPKTKDPDPYKCGGILINESSGPLQ